MSNTAAAKTTHELGSDRSLVLARRARLERRALLVAICALVFLVSLPRLQGIAIRENELDAQRALELLARELSTLEETGAPAASLAALVPRGSALARRLDDLELFAGGRLALRHGYLLELVPARAGEPAELLAWPWRLGTSGHAAFRLPLGRDLLAHPNDRGAGAPRWSGLERRPSPTDAGWRPVRLPRSRVEGS